MMFFTKQLKQSSLFMRGCDVTDMLFFSREDESANVTLTGRLSEAEEKIKVLHSCKCCKDYSCTCI